MASTVIQVYLKQVLESFFHVSHQVRMAALKVTTLILKQGLVHPVQVGRLLFSYLHLCALQVTPDLRRSIAFAIHIWPLSWFLAVCAVLDLHGHRHWCANQNDGWSAVERHRQKVPRLHSGQASDFKLVVLLIDFVRWLEDKSISAACLQQFAFVSDESVARHQNVLSAARNLTGHRDCHQRCEDPCGGAASQLEQLHLFTDQIQSESSTSNYLFPSAHVWWYRGYWLQLIFMSCGFHQKSKEIVRDWINLVRKNQSTQSDIIICGHYDILLVQIDKCDSKEKAPKISTLFAETATDGTCLHGRQFGVLPVPVSGRNLVHNSPDRHSSLRVRIQPVAVIPRGLSCCSKIYFHSVWPWSRFMSLHFENFERQSVSKLEFVTQSSASWAHLLKKKPHVFSVFSDLLPWQCRRGRQETVGWWRRWRGGSSAK